MRINTEYIQNLSASTNSNVSQNIEEQSFEDVLVLNQTALKAMAIDEMVKNSATGSIDPEAVTVAAVMKFRSTLPANIKAPEHVEDWNVGKPNVTDNSDKTNHTVNDITDDKPIDYSYKVEDVYNEGALKCNDELNTYFKEAAETYNVDVKLLKAIAFCESNFNPNATSRSGAMGVMQLMPKTAEGLGVTNAYDARQNILGGAKCIANHLNSFNGNIELALAAYNAGPGAVKKYNGVPPYQETQNYVVKVQKYYNS
jgi:hypothetical protein